MERDFWLERWRNSEIGFHQAAINPHLAANVDWLTRGRPSRALVPLCGKTLDMKHLAELGHSVVGVELAEDAARAFFDENQLPASRTQDGPFVRYESGRIEILVGDFFALEPGELGGFDAIFDRAALVALPPEMRARYEAHLPRFLAPRGRMLLVSFVYDGGMQGPPFSVPESEVRAAYGSLGALELHEDLDILEQSPRFRDRGATTMREHVWRFEQGE